MTKYHKEDIEEVYQAETHPTLDNEDIPGEMSKDKREYMSLFDTPEEYEDEIFEYDDYESDDIWTMLFSKMSFMLKKMRDWKQSTKIWSKIQ